MYGFLLWRPFVCKCMVSNVSFASGENRQAATARLSGRASAPPRRCCARWPRARASRGSARSLPPVTNCMGFYYGDACGLTCGLKICIGFYCGDDLCGTLLWMRRDRSALMIPRALTGAPSVDAYAKGRLAPLSFDAAAESQSICMGFYYGAPDLYLGFSYGCMETDQRL